MFVRVDSGGYDAFIEYLYVCKLGASLCGIHGRQCLWLYFFFFFLCSYEFQKLHMVYKLELSLTFSFAFIDIHTTTKKL